MNICKRMSMVRNARGLTIADMAARIGNSSYDRIETGKSNVTFITLIEICKALEIDIWDLVAEELVITYREQPKDKR